MSHCIILEVNYYSGSNDTFKLYENKQKQTTKVEWKFSTSQTRPALLADLRFDFDSIAIKLPRIVH